MAIVVEHFKEGDPVPPWLFSVEPKRPDSPPARLVFNGPIAVIETADSFYVVGEHSDSNESNAGFGLLVHGEPVSADGFRFVAASKPVKFPLEFLTIGAGAGTSQSELPPPRPKPWADRGR